MTSFSDTLPGPPWWAWRLLRLLYAASFSVAPQLDPATVSDVAQQSSNITASNLPPAPPLKAALGALLDTLGVEQSSTRLTAEEIVARALLERGHDATVTELRWGTLILEAPPAAARLLSFDKDQLQDLLNARLPGTVEHIHIRTVRR